MSDEPNVSVNVPTPDEFQGTEAQRTVFVAAQELLRHAIRRDGIDMGVSTVLSGITRELRRHMSLEDIQGGLRGLADSLPAVAQYDVKDKP